MFQAGYSKGFNEGNADEMEMEQNQTLRKKDWTEQRVG